MKKQKIIVVVSVLAIGAAGLLQGCGATSRYKADEFGPQQKGDMKKALANIDRAMSDMAATKKR